MKPNKSKTSDAKRFSVLVMDMFHYMDKEHETMVDGFKTFEAAREYARRRTRDSLEEQRPASTSRKDLRDRWFMFGEDCVVIGGEEYSGGQALDFFIANPATPEERDWASLTPQKPSS